ncbi:MAG: hypothetical protein IKR85_05415 [Clostridia bacterium]|nr:hypothetical protein [Clostridia bacterium]
MDLIKVDIERQPDIRFPDGGLKHAQGVRSYQILRANRAFPDEAEGVGWTYNHAPMLCWYAGRFYVEYLSCPVSEHETPGHTLLTSSADGINWDRPRVAFESIRVSLECYKGPRAEHMPESTLTVPHQRMGFYCGANGVMLLISFYGVVYDRALCSPCDGWGVGRAVRRLYPDGSLGGIYFLMNNEEAGFTKENTPYFPYYEHSGDAELISACRELLSNRPVLNQMYEEQKRDRSLFPKPLGKAGCFYTAADGRVVTLFKLGLGMVSEDGGRSFGEIRANRSVKTATGKIWGQKLSTGGYALFYNPTPDAQHRWPIALVTGADGYTFSNMRALTGRFSPARYGGLDKNPGPQYMRGISENNPQPPDGRAHIVYSVNKEDIWITHLLLPVKDEDAPKIEERFDAGAIPEKWSVYRPKWTEIAPEADGLAISDREPCDCALVERQLRPSESGCARLDLSIEEVSGSGEVCAELEDEAGGAAARITFENGGRVRVLSAGRAEGWTDYACGLRLTLRLAFDCRENRFTATLNGAEKRFSLNTACDRICRFSVFTKAPARIPYADIGTSGKYGRYEDVLPDCEQRTPPVRLKLCSFEFETEPD